MSEVPETSPAPFGGIEIGRREVAHRIISARLREQILRGEIAAGTGLPPTGELAEQWKTSYFTVHTALKNLVKEGFLERKHGSGTYVREQRVTFDHVGLYFNDTSVWTDDEKAFYRNVYGALEARLKKLRVQLRLFVDSRPKDRQHTVMPEIRRAMEGREIQGLIAGLVHEENLRWLLKLPLPLSLLSSGANLANKVNISDPHNFSHILARLKAHGCRTVGVISNTYASERSRVPSERLNFDEQLEHELKAAGITSRPSWIRKASKNEPDMARHGYREFKELWSQPERPDAVIAFPDMVVRGVILSALELGVKPPRDVRFFFHRNAHVNLLCPFSAGWWITDEDKIAEALIGLVRDQHNGKKVQPVYVPNRFEELEAGF